MHQIFLFQKKDQKKNAPAALYRYDPGGACYIISGFWDSALIPKPAPDNRWALMGAHLTWKVAGKHRGGCKERPVSRSYARPLNTVAKADTRM